MHQLFSPRDSQINEYSNMKLYYTRIAFIPIACFLASAPSLAVNYVFPSAHKVMSVHEFREAINQYDLFKQKKKLQKISP